MLQMAATATAAPSSPTPTPKATATGTPVSLNNQVYLPLVTCSYAGGW